MKKVILSLGEVARTGRTTFVEVLHAWLNGRGVSHLLAHSDAERPGDLSRSTYLDAGNRLSAEDFIALLDQASTVVVDLASGTTDEFFDRYEREEMGEILGEMDAVVTLVMPVTSSRQTESAVLRAAEAFRDGADYVLMRNPGASRAWALPNAGRAMHYLGALELAVPALPRTVAGFLDENRLELPQLISRMAGLSRAVQPVLRSWQIDYFAAMDAVDDLFLGADPMESPPVLPGRPRGERAPRRRKSPSRRQDA